TGALIRWTTTQPAPAGFEIWRSADPQQPAARVGSVASGTTTFTDPKPLPGTSYYQVIALGGGARAASSWTAASAGGAMAAPAPGAGASACGCPGPQGPPGPPGPAGPPGTTPKELLQQIATLQTQLDALKAVLAVDAAHSVTLTAGHDLQEQIGGSQSVSVALDRTTHVARDDSLTIGGSSVTSVGKSWQVAGAQDVQLSAGTGITLQAKNARYFLGTSEGSAYLPGNWTETVDRDRAAKVGRNDALNIGMGAVTSVGTNWDLSAAQAVAVKAGKQLSLSSGQASVLINPDSSVAISGTKVSISASGDLQLSSGGAATLNGVTLTSGPAAAAQGFGTNNHPASGGTGASCTLGDVTLTAGGIGTGTPADGRVLSITGNIALFAVFGTNFGGDGKTTFALPDLRAVAPNGLTYMICTQGVFPQHP
ncbi:MAG TPA: phage tail protein, partial [Steroidobacteraceae bacterium]|nr:phage tail protein [Steroidobacteraceae bacterium]